VGGRRGAGNGATVLHGTIVGQKSHTLASLKENVRPSKPEGAKVRRKRKKTHAKAMRRG